MGTAIRLEDGWGVDTPVGDTLLHRYVLNLAAFHEAMGTAMGGRTMRRDDVVAADLGHPAGWYNSAVLLRPADHIEDVVADVEAFYDGHGCGDVERWGARGRRPTSPAAAGSWKGHPPLLVRPTGPAPAAPDPVSADRGGVRRGRRAELGARRGRRPDVRPLLPGAIADDRLLTDPRFRLWVGYVEHRSGRCSSTPAWATSPSA